MNDDALTRNGQGELAVRTVSTSGDNYVDKNDVYTRDNDGKLCIRITGDGGGGGGESHFMGWFANESALTTAYPTAEDGDYAIVVSTGTVWVWDETNSEWIDSEQSIGAVDSVNGQTGVVVLDAEDVDAVPQLDTMPTAASTNEGLIVMYSGATDSTYTNGYFYKCIEDSENPGTYLWTQTDVQPQQTINYPVTSVNTKTGAVVLDASDVGAEVATTLTTISTATVTQELATSTIYNCGEMTSIEITFPVTASTGFISQLNFTSGTTPTAFTSPVGMKWLGNDVSTTFVPVASKRYAIMFFYDGTAYRGIVQAA